MQPFQLGRNAIQFK